MITEDTKPTKIIFILGIMPRSGTHFLANLLCHHPDCVQSVIPEDGLVGRADFLVQYINQLLHVWEVNGDLSKVSFLSPKELMLESLGKGLSAFLKSAQEISLKEDSQKNDLSENKMPSRLVTKTPQVINLDKFFKLFPDGQLLILVRDGRALVESINKSFDYPREEAIRDWANAARKIIKFDENEQKNKKKYLIVKYEELHTRTEEEMRKILKFLNLDINKYDFQNALDIPVVGSSDFKRGDGEVHWLPVKKTKDFNPLARAANWTRSEHERFNWLAKDESRQLGYEPTEFEKNKFLWKIWNRFYDFCWQAGIWKNRFYKFLHIGRKRLYIYFGK